MASEDMNKGIYEDCYEGGAQGGDNKPPQTGLELVERFWANCPGDKAWKMLHWNCSYSLSNPKNIYQSKEPFEFETKEATGIDDTIKRFQEDRWGLNRRLMEAGYGEGFTQIAGWSEEDEAKRLEAEKKKAEIKKAERRAAKMKAMEEKAAREAEDRRRAEEAKKNHDALLAAAADPNWMKDGDNAGPSPPGIPPTAPAAPPMAPPPADDLVPTPPTDGPVPAGPPSDEPPSENKEPGKDSTNDEPVLKPGQAVFRRSGMESFGMMVPGYPVEWDVHWTFTVDCNKMKIVNYTCTKERRPIEIKEDEEMKE